MRRLAAGHLHLVRPIALRIWRSIGRRVDIDDLIGHGVDGLVQAAARYDARRGASFATFAAHRIRGAIYDAVRAECRLAALRHELRAARFIERPADDARTVSAALAVLDERGRRLIHEIYFEDRPLIRAGLRLGISKSWASRLHARSLQRLREQLTIAGSAPDRD
jgi:RNA polymerase sigma factor for flagellar operon FliA